MRDVDLNDARACLDRAASARPRVDGEALTAATKALCRRRDTIIGQAAAAPGRQRQLGALNVVIGLVQAVHYPLDTTPWALLDQAREVLGDLAEHAP